MDIHVYIHDSNESKLDQIISLLTDLKMEQTKMDAATTSALANLNAAVAQETTVDGSVVTLLQGMAVQITALGANQTDPAVATAIAAAAAIVSNNVSGMAAAVAANTPAAPPAPAGTTGTAPATTS